jgi:hypothetical protein
MKPTGEKEVAEHSKGRNNEQNWVSNKREKDVRNKESKEKWIKEDEEESKQETNGVKMEARNRAVCCYYIRI